MSGICKSAAELALVFGLGLAIPIAMKYVLARIEDCLPARAIERRYVQSVLCPGRWFSNLSRRIACLVIGAKPSVVSWPFRTLVPERYVLLKKDRRLPWLLDGLFITSGIWFSSAICVLLISVWSGFSAREVCCAHLDALSVPNLIPYCFALLCTAVSFAVDGIANFRVLLLIVPTVYITLCFAYGIGVDLAVLKEVALELAIALMVLWGLNSLHATERMMDACFAWVLPRIFVVQAFWLVALGIEILFWLLLRTLVRKLGRRH